MHYRFNDFSSGLNCVLNAKKDSVAREKDNKLAAMIRRLWARLSITQEQFATKVGVTFSSVNRGEHGKNNPFPLAFRRTEEMQERLCKR